MTTKNEDELDNLRIPYEMIKFGKNLESHGYGSVFEGVFADERVALKRLNISYFGSIKPKLLTEILNISRFRNHPNLVALLGFCDEKSHEMILVYEYVSGGNLAENMKNNLTTIQRLEICLDAARGLDCLHTGVDAFTPGIVHGNITTSKILLTLDLNLQKFKARVSGFGLSKRLPAQPPSVVKEKTAKLTKESDIYSFGVLLLEVLYGEPPTHVTDAVEHNHLRAKAHPGLKRESKTESLETYVQIALRCKLESPEERPSMAQVVKELKKALRLQQDYESGEMGNKSTTNDPNSTEEAKYDHKNIIPKNEVDNESKITTPTSSESNNGDEDGLDHIRIPYEKIKFGKNLESHGYGSVFEGVFADRRVALKRLNISYFGSIKPKLLTEILNISRFQDHPNLVALLGFCDEKSHEMILVYEYVSGGNLAENMKNNLTTIQRLEICIGAARGLDCLHTGVDAFTPGIVHGNITTSKIMLSLDSSLHKFEAKVSGFGLSKRLPAQPPSLVKEKTAGLTKESDIYSFGVLLLEVLYGEPPTHATDALKKLSENNHLRTKVHPDLKREIKAESLETYIKIVRQCMLEIPEERPSMAQVVTELEKALRLEMGEVSDVQIVDSKFVDDSGLDNQSKEATLE